MFSFMMPSSKLQCAAGKLPRKIQRLRKALGSFQVACRIFQRVCCAHHAVPAEQAHGAFQKRLVDALMDLVRASLPVGQAYKARKCLAQRRLFRQDKVALQ